MVAQSRIGDRGEVHRVGVAEQEAGVIEPRRAGHTERLTVFPGQRALLIGESVHTGRARVIQCRETFDDEFSSHFVTVIATDPGEVGVRRGLDVLHILARKSRTDGGREAAPSGVKKTENRWKLVDVKIFRRTERALIKLRQKVRVHGLKVTKTD